MASIRMLVMFFVPTFLAVLMLVSPKILAAVTLPLFFEIPGWWIGPEAALRSIAFLQSLPSPWPRPRDDAFKICEFASLFTEHWKAVEIRTRQNVDLFMTSCLRVLPSVEPAVRQTLESKLHTRALNELTLPPPEKPPNPYIDDWRTCSSRHSRVDEAELFDTSRVIYEKSGVPPLKPRHVKPSEVREALERAEVVTFDARGIIPARMFNSTLLDLGRLHPDVALHADTGPKTNFGVQQCAWSYFMTMQRMIREGFGGGPGSLLEWMHSHGWSEEILANRCGHWITLSEVGERLPYMHHALFNLSHNDVEYQAAVQHSMRLLVAGLGLLGSNVNVLRLPKWTRDDFDMSTLFGHLGLEGLAEYAHNLLWVGASPGGMHNDIQDNVLIQITGESELLIVPANCSLQIDLGNGFRLASVDWLKGEGKDMAYFLIKLTPGDAVVIPSNSMHVVSSQDPSRIGMNFFIEPKHGQMQWPYAPANFYNVAGEGHLALRSLWVRTIEDMWKTRPHDSPSYIIHGERQEFI